MEECPHSQIINLDGSTVCVDCGLNIEENLIDTEAHYYGASDTRYSKDPSRHSQRKNEERTLYSDLEQNGFPADIIERANNYYKEIIKNNIYRAKNRRSIVFACTYHAYEDIGEPRVPGDLALIFKLDKKKVSNGLKLFSHVFRKRPGKKYIDAMDIVPKLLIAMNIDESRHENCVKDIRMIYNFVNSKSKSFSSSNPQSIAAGLIYYYLLLNNITVKRAEFAKIVHLTDITFTRISNDITRTIDAEPT